MVMESTRTVQKPSNGTKKAAHQGNEDAEKFLRKMGVAVK